MLSPINYPQNSCQAYHTPSYLQESLKNMTYNKHFCFVHQNISFYCLLSEFVNFRPNGSFLPPITLEYLAGRLINSLLQVQWPGRLDRKFIEAEMTHIFLWLDTGFLKNLRRNSPSFLRENEFSCCSVSLMLCQNGYLWGVQLGKNRIGLCSPSAPTGTPTCVSPCNEHSYESNTEQTRLANTGLSHYELTEFFQYQHCFMPTRCIGNIILKQDYYKTLLHGGNSPPAICQPDIWGPIDIEYKQINYAFIMNDDLYKVFECHCMFKPPCQVMEKIGDFIIQDHANNDNSQFKLFNDCGRRVIETVLKAVGPPQLNDLYKRYNIIDMGIVIADFDMRYYSSTRSEEAPGMDRQVPSNPSGPLGVVLDPYVLTPPPSISSDQCNLTTNRQSEYLETTYHPPNERDRSYSEVSLYSRRLSSSLPYSGVPSYLKFEESSPIWNISLEQIIK